MAEPNDFHTTKRCPFCAEEIQSVAIVCKYCGRDLVTPPPTRSSFWPWLVITVGAAVLEFFAVFDDTSVSTGDGTRIHNIGLMQEEQNGLLVAFAIVAVGLVWLLSQRKKQRKLTGVQVGMLVVIFLALTGWGWYLGFVQGMLQ